MTADEIVHTLKCQAKSAYHDAIWVQHIRAITGASKEEAAAMLEKQLADERRLSFPPRG